MLTIAELAVDPSVEVLQAYILVKLLLLAWHLAPTAYKGLSILVRPSTLFLVIIILIHLRFLAFSTVQVVNQQ